MSPARSSKASKVYSREALLWIYERNSRRSARERAVAALAPTIVYLRGSDVAPKSETAAGTIIDGSSNM